MTGAVARPREAQGAPQGSVSSSPALLGPTTPLRRSDGTAQERAAQERAARRTLRAQIARLERELSDAFVTAYPMGGLDQPVARPAHPRLLDLGELEVVRDELAERLREARVTIAGRADEQAAKRVELERMLLRPADYRFTRISCHELGDPGCGVWQVRPRMGLIGMLMGWWQIKLSSGCPLPTGRRRALARMAVSFGSRHAVRHA